MGTGLGRRHHQLDRRDGRMPGEERRRAATSQTSSLQIRELAISRSARDVWSADCMASLSPCCLRDDKIESWRSPPRQDQLVGVMIREQWQKSLPLFPSRTDIVQGWASGQTLAPEPGSSQTEVFKSLKPRLCVTHAMAKDLIDQLDYSGLNCLNEKPSNQVGQIRSGKKLARPCHLERP